MHDFAFEFELVAGTTPERRNLASLTPIRNGMAVKPLRAGHQPAGGLRHAFDQQHSRHQRVGRKVAFEIVLCCGTEQADRTERASTSSATMRSIIWKYSRRIDGGALSAFSPRSADRSGSLKFLSTKY